MQHSNQDLSPRLFWNTLFDNTPDGVIFVDSLGNICAWNQTMELLTGLSEKRVVGMPMKPELIGLSDAFGIQVTEGRDPFSTCLTTQKIQNGNYKLSGRSGRELKIEMKVVPVPSVDNHTGGLVAFVHDSSSQLDLQRQLKDLYEFSMLDPLTQVANRAEFERSLDQFVRNHADSDFQCSLIICDIDFFKQINDNYNHHVGDQALIAFAGLLKQFVRAQDVVARYGGEEFVILCANCDQNAAVERAEEIRKKLRSTPQPMLDGKYITASFGVSQLQHNESTTDFFVRADTALLHAKETGRNRVVPASQLIPQPNAPIHSKDQSQPASPPDSPPSKSPVPPPTKQALFDLANHQDSAVLISNVYRSRTPIPVLVEKLRGYIIEVDAEIKNVDTNHACLNVEFEDPENYTRKGRFEVEINFQESDDDEEFGRRQYTYLRITVREGQKRWFSTNAVDLAPLVEVELRRYFALMDDESSVQEMQPATVYKERHA